jgi:CRISPR-associated protein Csb3
MSGIVVPVEARNPGGFLAACGVAEIVGRFDSKSVFRWAFRNVALGHRQQTSLRARALVVETMIEEVELATALLHALSCIDRWEAIRLDNHAVPLAEASKDEPVVALHVSVRLREREERFTLDHWYHELPRADDEPSMKKRRLQQGKSRWKFWGGRMSLQKTLLGDKRKPGLITALAASNGPPRTLGDLIVTECETGSSLNFDAAARPAALDRGLAANEAKRAGGDTAAARPALELLAAVGLSAFFPPRRTGRAREAGQNDADRDGFRYHLWPIGLPLPIARLVARGIQFPGLDSVEHFEARRVSAGGKNYRFEYVRGAGLTLTGPWAELQEEEGDYDVDFSG